MKNEILCVIPARGGSKGIPSKNIQKICGKPLIQYTIETAKNSKLISRIIVSTDSEKIAKIARKLGVEVPFMRPKKISNDYAVQYDVVKHATKVLAEKESYSPEIIIVLQPTSPIRSSKMIDKAINLLKQGNSTSVISVSRVKSHPDIIFQQIGKYLKPLNKNFEKHSIRQTQSKLYGPTGSIYTFWNKTLENYNSIYGSRIKPLIIKENEFNIDIDTPFDLFIAQMTILHWKQFKQKFEKNKKS